MQEVEVQFGVWLQNGCQEIIGKAFAPYGILLEDVPNTFDIDLRMIYQLAREKEFRS